MMIRLDKYMADSGRWTRSDARELIRSGRVLLLGVPCTAPDTRIDPAAQAVSVDGEELRHGRFRYFMLDKPVGVLTATEDRRQQTVLDLLTPELRRLRLFPVGRLDRDTTGLLLLTDDGDYAHRVISPRCDVEKVYLAETEGALSEADVAAFAAGLTLRDGTRCLPAGLEILSDCRCLVTVREGKYHQVKRMLASRGAPVTALRRLSIGSLQIDEKLGSGGFRELSEGEARQVFQPLR
jgi:16S rRNA pseudouridine516 synthase